MPNPQDWLLATSGIVGAIVVIIGGLRMFAPVRRRMQAFFDRMERANDVVLGSPAIPDPDRPGEFLRPAIPDIGVRMTKTETLLEEFIVGVVQEAKDAAVSGAAAAAAAARSADEAREAAATTAGRFDDLTGQVGELSGQVAALATQVGESQNWDRIKAEMATAVLHEVVRDIPAVQERVG